MNGIAWALLLATVMLDGSGQIAFKAAAIAPVSADRSRWMTTFANPLTWIGVSLYVAEFVVWLAFISLVPLSNGVLLASINVVVVLIGGRLFFAERVTAAQIVCVGFIVLGVGLVGWS